MNPDLIAEFDAATQALDALAAASIEAPRSIEDRLSRDIADLRLHGLESWQTRWIHKPLRAIRAIEGLRLKLMVELDEVRQELQGVEAHLSLLREAGRITDAEFASRPAVRLLCHEADVRERLKAPVTHRISTARNGIARVLEVSLRQEGREAMRLANESVKPGADPALAEEAYKRAEGYNRLVAEAHRVTGGVDVPIFPPDQVARLRELWNARRPAKVVRTKAAAAPTAAPTTAAPATASEPGPAAAPRLVRPVPSPQPAAQGLPAVPPSLPVVAPNLPMEAPKTRPSLPRLRGLRVGAL
jgi:hypothetical protein